MSRVADIFLIFNLTMIFFSMNMYINHNPFIIENKSILFEREILQPFKMNTLANSENFCHV